MGRLVIAIDVVLIGLVTTLSEAGYHYLRFESAGDPLQSLAVAAVISAVLIPVLSLRGLYNSAELMSLSRQIITVLITWIGVLVFLAGVTFALKIGERFSRGTFVSLTMFGGAALVLHRIVWRVLLESSLATGRLGRTRVALVSPTEQEGFRVARSLRRYGWEVANHVLLPQVAGKSEAELRRVLLRKVGPPTAPEIREVVVTASWNETKEVLRLLEQLRLIPVPVRFVPDEATAKIMCRPWQTLGSSMVVELQRAPLTFSEQVLKRAFDVVLASFGLIMMAPLLIATAVVIAVESGGPVLFRQTRHGFDGQQFKILKFRTMTVTEEGPSVRQAVRNDRRVTRVGYWLRRSSIDELPQLFNVLRGEMSVVGPRPHAVAHNDFYTDLIAGYAMRHHMRPGLTGWAQVNGHRGETPTLESMVSRVELDIWYVDNWSLRLDLLIVVRTILTVFRSPNAY